MTRGVLLALFSVLALAAPANGAGPLVTGFLDPESFSDASRRDQSFAQARSAGATTARLILYWPHVAPATRPPGFEATNHLDPAYNWAGFDAQVQAAAARGLTPIVAIMFAPPWAEGAGPGEPGTVRVNSVEYGKFAQAAATRYNGLALPRVRYWQAWSEPNRDYFFMPQYAGRRIVSAARYRALVNQLAAAVHGVSPANRVVAGGLAPLGKPGKPAPMAFMRQLLCMSTALRRTCDLRSSPVRFDIWSHHPYTSGGPTHHAFRRDDVALGDLPEMRRLLRAAVRAGQVRPIGGVRFWVTEFSWDSNPPDPKALGTRLHRRWTAEALFRMWQHGVSLVTWFLVNDLPIRTSPFQSGLFLANGRAKPSMRAFRFPLVAFTRRGGVYVWGRTPTGARGRVAIEIKSGRSWRRLGSLNAGSSGIFRRTFRTRPRSGHVRARAAGETSLAFSLRNVPDRFVNPFGCGGGLPC